jgi:hypothetical protein
VAYERIPSEKALEIKTCEAFGFRHQLTAERQCLFALSRRENRIRVFDLPVK